MSELNNAKIKELAKGMTKEDMAVFLKEVPRELLVGEIDRRLKEKENLDAGLNGLIRKYERSLDDWKQNDNR